VVIDGNLSARSFRVLQNVGAYAFASKPALPIARLRTRMVGGSPLALQRDRHAMLVMTGVGEEDG
jgi:hypothetical protein